MRMRTEFAHAERKALALRCGDSGHKGPLTCSNRHVSQLKDNSERCSENPWKGGERISTSARRQGAGGGARVNITIRVNSGIRQLIPPGSEPAVRPGSEPAVLRQALALGHDRVLRVPGRSH